MTPTSYDDLVTVIDADAPARETHSVPDDHGDGPVFPIPSSLSPSRVSSSTSCPMQFRFSSVERLPEAPGVATTRGSVVHLALEHLFVTPAAERTAAALHDCLDRALDDYADHPDYVGLRLDDDQAASFRRDCIRLVDRYLEMEDPTAVREIGLELRLSAAVGSLELRGIIARLELDADGELVVTDYKTGRPPSGNYEQKSLAGVPSAQAVRFIETRTSAVWKAVERACDTGDFRPRTSRLCDFCSFRAWGQAFGGVPAQAACGATAAYEALMTPVAASAGE